MIELLAKFKYNIDWKNYLDWNGHTSSNVKFYDNSDGYSTCYWSGWGITTISKDILKKNTKYKVKFKVVKRKSTDVEGTIKVYVGDSISSYVVSENEEYEMVLNSLNSQLLKFKNGSIDDVYGISNVSIEEVDNQIIDLYENPGISLNFSISDIQDISKRKGTYSKTIRIPGNSNNNNFFKYVFDINIEGNYNPNSKTEAIITSHNDVIIEGFIQMVDIYKYDDKTEYEILFFGKSLDLFTAIGDTKLSELDWSHLDHTADYTTVRGSMISPSSYGFTYPYIDYGLNRGGLRGIVGAADDETVGSFSNVGLSISDLYPAIRAKTIVDNIFNHFNFSYSSSTIFDSNSFENMIIPFNGKESQLYDWHSIAKWTTNYNMNHSNCRTRNNGSGDAYQLTTTGKFVEGYTYNLGYDGIPSHRSSSEYLTRVTDYFSRLNTDEKFTKDWDFTTGEGGPQYHSIPYPSGWFMVPKSGKYKVKCKYKVNSISGPGSTPRVVVKAFKLNVAALEITSFTPPIFTVGADAEETFSLGNFLNPYGMDTWTSNEIDCIEGDFIGVKVMSDTGTQFDLEIDNIEIESNIWGRDCDIKGNNIISQDMKVKDFLSDIFNMYNAFIDVSRTDIKTLSIETRNQFYENGSTLDWTMKQDKDSEIKIGHPNSFRKKYLNYKYSDGTDYWNDYYSEYKDRLEVGYGGKQIVIENEINEGTQELKLNFKPSVLRSDWKVKGDNDKKCYVVTSYKNGDVETKDINYETNTEIGDRILFYQITPINDNVSLTQKFRMEDNNPLSFGGNSYYPYCGHMRFPFEQDYSSSDCLDLNFETTMIDYKTSTWQLMFQQQPSGTISNSNLYNLFWSNYVRELTNKDARIVTSYFNLSDLDIKNFNFEDNIFVDGTYYSVLNIGDYKPGENQLTKVDLLKRFDMSIDFEQYTEVTEDETYLPPMEPIEGIEIGKDNVKPTGFGGLIIGDKNVIGKEANNTLIQGNGNVVKKKGSVIIGSDNINLSEKSVILGADNITVKSGVTGTIVIGEKGIKISDDDTTYINGVKIHDGTILSSNGLIDGGTIELDGNFNPYKFKSYHINSGGENGNDILDINIWEIEDGGEID